MRACITHAHAHATRTRTTLSEQTHARARTHTHQCMSTLLHPHVRTRRHPSAGARTHIANTHACPPVRASAWTHLDLLDLARHHRQHLRLNAVELVEAAPRAALHQAAEDGAHGLVVQALPAVEHHAQQRHGLGKVLGCLRLACSTGVCVNIYKFWHLASSFWAWARSLVVSVLPAAQGCACTLTSSYTSQAHFGHEPGPWWSLSCLQAHHACSVCVRVCVHACACDVGV